MYIGGEVKDDHKQIGQYNKMINSINKMKF